jgi:hypothetical protein
MPAAWLVGIIVNLPTVPGRYDVALRDFGLLLGALTLDRLAIRLRLAGASGRLLTAEMTVPGSLTALALVDDGGAAPGRIHRDALDRAAGGLVQALVGDVLLEALTIERSERP